MNRGEIERQIDVLRRGIGGLQEIAAHAAPKERTALRTAAETLLRAVAGLEAATRTPPGDVPDPARGDEAERRLEAERATGDCRALMEQAADAIFTSDLTGNHLEGNTRGCELLGYTREEIVQLWAHDLFVAADLVTDPLRFDRLGQRETLRRERRMRRKDGTFLPVELCSRMLADGRVQSIVRDITGRMRAQEALRESEAKYRILAEETLAGVYILQDGKLVYVNRRLAEMGGYTVEEMIGREVVELIVPEHRGLVSGNISRRLAGEVASLHYNFAVLCKDGSSREVEAYGTIALYDGREAIIGTLLDRTEERRALEALQKSEERYRDLMEQAADAIFVADSQGSHLLDVNPAACELLGYAREELLATGAQSIFAADELVDQPLRFDLLGHGETVRRERRLRCKDGTFVVVELSTKMISKGHILSIMRDITERKRAQQALQESEAKYRILAEEALVGVYILQDGKFAYVNRRFAETCGYTVEEMLGRDFLQQIAPEHRGMVAENVRRRLSGEEPSLHYSFTALYKDGSPREVEVYGITSRYNGRPAIMGTMLDRSDELKTIEALRRSEENYRILMEQAPDAIMITDRDFKIVEANTSSGELLGCKREVLLGMHVADLFTPEGLAAQPLHREVLEGKTLLTERRLQRLDGTVVEAEVHVKMLADGRLSAIWRDITVRKQVEERLREAESKYRTLVEQLPAIVYLVDLDRPASPQYISAQIETSLGYAPDDWTRRPRFWEERLHPGDRARVQAEVARCLAAGNPFMCEYRLLDRDGKVHWFRDQNVILPGEDGRPQFVQGVLLDVTERQVERAGRERLQALSRHLVEAQEGERRRMGRELHDEVGQRLTGVKLAIEMASKLPAAAARVHLHEASRLLDDLLARVRDLSIDLRPSLLDDLGLLPALLWLIDRFSRETRVLVDFTHRGLQHQRFTSEVETVAYRIVQEALTNVARHAGTGRARVRAWADAGNLGVQVEDDGVGFDAQATMASPAAIGLAGIQERVSLVGGRLNLESAPGQGCCLAAEFPLGDVGSEREQ